LTYIALAGGGDGDAMEAVLEAGSAEEVDEVREGLSLLDDNLVVAAGIVCSSQVNQLGRGGS
jgi:hypothetical protein